MSSSQSEPSAAPSLVALFGHNTWANLKLLEFCAHLSDAQLDTTSIGGYGSIRDTLVHIVSAEVGYVRRVNGKQPNQPQPNGDEFPPFAVLSDVARWTGDELLQLALGAHDDTLVRQPLPEGIGQYKLTDLMAQAITHSVEHRTQIAATITFLNMEPPDLSGWAWMTEKGDLVITPHT